MQGGAAVWNKCRLLSGNGIRRKTAPAMHQITQDQTMKKIIVIAATISFAAALNVSAADAKTNWDSLCAKCHGADGKGQTKMGQKLGVKDFTDAKVQAEIKDDAAFKAIKEGKKDADGRTLMKAFDTLSDDEVKALVGYVRGLKS
jgi:mono/diheme cytochrome c family protein